MFKSRHKKSHPKVASEPGWFQKIKSAAIAMFKAVKDPRKVSSKHYNARMDVCAGCEFKRKNKCLACGCHIPLKGKLRVWSCDLGKWDGVDKQYGLLKQDSMIAKLEWRMQNRIATAHIVEHNGDILIQDNLTPVPDGYEWSEELGNGWVKYRHISDPQPCIFRRMVKRSRELTVEPLCLVQIGPPKQIDFSTCLGCDKAISPKCQKDSPR